VPEEWSPHPRSPVLPSWGCPPGVCAELPILYVVFAPPIFVPKHNVWFLDDRSHTSGALIVHRSVSCQVCPSRLSLVEPSARIMGDLVEVALGSPPSLVINVEAGFPGPSQLDTASATELTMEDYQEPTGVGGDYHR
jgi:hypothetical protein